MQLQKINDSLYRHKTELMNIEVREDGDQWTTWIETRTECHNNTQETLFEAILFSTAFWQDLIGKEWA
tara:strand:+ start:1575 stop:1778 length:204 start_codon:yes stop_codon:yes gene_type:complete